MGPGLGWTLPLIRSDKETSKGSPVNKKRRSRPVVTGQRAAQRKNSPRQWGRPFGRAPWEICPAISTHLHWGGDCTTTMRWQDAGTFFCDPMPSPPSYCQSPRQWRRPFGRVPWEICPAISTHLHWGGDCTTTMRWQDAGTFFCDPMPSPPSYCQIPNTAIGHVTSPTPIWTSKSPMSLRRNFFFLPPFAVSFAVFAAMATVFFYPHIFTGSVGSGILIVVPVDTLYRTSIISSSTVLPLNPFVNLSSALLSLFSIYGPDLGVWPDCWVSAEFLRAPIPRKGSGSTITTTFLFWSFTSCRRAKSCL